MVGGDYGPMGGPGIGLVGVDRGERGKEKEEVTHISLELLKPILHKLFFAYVCVSLSMIAQTTPTR